jgi:glutathione S-transferase
MIRLYRAEWSTNCERVALALAHKGLEAESVVIEYSDRTPVQEVSGQGLVPVIVDGDEVVFDSPRILAYLEERYPDPPLFPADPARRAETDLFIEWFDGVWKPVANEMEMELGRDEPDGERIGALAMELGRHLDRFERLLTGRPYLLGEAVSVADFVAFPFLKYATGRDPADTELFHRLLDEHQSVDGRPNLAAWIERIDALPRAYGPRGVSGGRSLA